MSETLSVTAIKNGTVIDHIAEGQATHIIHLLALKSKKHKITIGLHLPSKRIGVKDIIKIEDRALSEEEANEIVVFAPDATINVIENFVVTKKIKTHLPQFMKGVFSCPNLACITQTEPVESHFNIIQHSKHVKLQCHYCDRLFEHEQVKLKIYPV
jgi:aspartate carbamoyltransferase regulatory subunit